MTDYPTIRIKCDERFRDRALLMARDGLRLAAGAASVDAIDSSHFTVLGRHETHFHVKRTKTGVTVRQIEGMAV